MPKVSVIIIIYKVEMFLRECLESVINQTYENLEIILVVGKGDTGCEDISKEYSVRDARIKLIIDEPRGTAVARNQGLDAVTGDYIAFVDGDDYIDADMIEVMVNAAIRHDADVSVIGKYYLYENIIEGTCENIEEVYNIRDAFCTILYNDKFFLHMWDKLYKKQLFDGIRFDQGKRVEDRQMAVKILNNAQKLVYNSASKYYFRVSSDSGSRVADNLKLSLDADKEIVDDLINKYPDLNDASKYFLMMENMSVIQSAFLYDIYMKNEYKEELSYVRKHLIDVMKMEKCGKSMTIKMILCGYFPKIFKSITIKRRRKFLESHKEFGSGNDWQSTFNKQNIN